MEIDLLLCPFCDLKNTKYSCIDCGIIVCNVYPVSVGSNYSGYNEELKKVGVCKKCSKKEISVMPLRQKVQKNIYSMFLKQTVSQKQSNNIVLSNPKQFSLSSVSASNQKTIPATVEKSKSELVTDAVAKWLICKTDNNGKAKDLKCNFSISYGKEIHLMPSYSNPFVAVSRNYKKLAIEDHAKHNPHMKTCQLYLCSQGVPLDKRAKSFSSNLGNESIVSGFSKKDPKELPVMNRKFEVTYFIAKNELPFNKYKKILSLEKHHGVQMGDSYIIDTACANFIDFIGLGLKDQLNKDLVKAKFFVVLSDGSTDSSLIENKTIYCLYFDPSPIGSDSV